MVRYAECAVCERVGDEITASIFKFKKRLSLYILSAVSIFINRLKYTVYLTNCYLTSAITVIQLVEFT